MINKEQLLKIDELKLAGRIEEMDDSRIKEYCSLLEKFVDALPNQESDMKCAIAAKDYSALCAIVQNIEDELKGIYADDLAQNCLKFISDVKNSKQRVIEAHFTYLLTTISMLSIEIQMAQHEATHEKQEFIIDAPVEAAAIQNERPKTILAVDDVSLVLNGLKMIMQDTSYKLTCVSSAETALRFIATHTPDLFILDIEMPGMNGYELAGKIRERGHNAPIIFLTGNATQEYLLKAIQAGAADFIVKPVTKEFVLEKIEKYIG